ncbi:hypothetical protein EDC01DRAFT_761718 [Geopyxis carbonaria]|nr:hypothetical protein EDC01DRAFT_761718 [Geopyxis carbonaria]
MPNYCFCDDEEYKDPSLEPFHELARRFSASRYIDDPRQKVPGFEYTAELLHEIAKARKFADNDFHYSSESYERLEEEYMSIFTTKTLDWHNEHNPYWRCNEPHWIDYDADIVVLEALLGSLRLEYKTAMKEGPPTVDRAEYSPPSETARCLRNLFKDSEYRHSPLLYQKIHKTRKEDGHWIEDPPKITEMEIILACTMILYNNLVKKWRYPLVRYAIDKNMQPKSSYGITDSLERDVGVRAKQALNKKASEIEALWGPPGKIF